jgi:hypothetical protein
MSQQVEAQGMKMWDGSAWIDMRGKTKVWDGTQWITPSKMCMYQASNDTWYCVSSKRLPQLVIVGSGGNIITNEDIPND